MQLHWSHFLLNIQKSTQLCCIRHTHDKRQLNKKRMSDGTLLVESEFIWVCYSTKDYLYLHVVWAAVKNTFGLLHILI